MSLNTNQTVRSIETQMYSTEASKLLLKQGGRDGVQDFLESLGYETQHYQAGLKGVCPACGASFCAIRLNGTVHPINWKCFRKCSEGEQRKYVPNLVGLVKAILPSHHQGEAIKAIANYLGCEHPFDITNGKFKGNGEQVPEKALSTVEPIEEFDFDKYMESKRSKQGKR